MTVADDSTYKAALDYIGRGWAVVPIPSRSKEPVGKEWQKLEISPENLDLYFNGKPQNIGVRLGEASGWLVDIDLDSPEAVTLADYFLPATDSEFGRLGKPRSHRLYRCAGTKYKKYNHPLMIESKDEGQRKKACIVEIRSAIKGKGIQTVFPPSVHEEGEAIEWFKDGEPATTPAAEFRGAVNKLAAASLLVRYWWKDVRHELAMALSGTLLRHGWSEPETKHFIEAICHAAHDEETNDRLQAVGDTATKLAAGQEATGRPTLIDLTDRKIVDRMCEWLGIGGEKNPDTPHSAADEDGEKTSAKENQSQKIMGLVEAAGVRFFHTADGDTYATIPLDSHNENHDLRSKFFKQWVGRQYWLSERKVPNSQAMNDALNALKGKALFDSPQHEIFVRLAGCGEKIYLDLANDLWQVVEMSADGWRIIESSEAPVKFRRPKGLLRLPTPESGGDLKELEYYINVVPEHFPLVLIYLMASLRPDKPFPITILNGEQGSAKSTTTRVFKRMIDPNIAELRPPPRDERDLMIAATNGWFLAFDNLAKIPDSLSDALCRLSTGGGFGTRTLYENDEETLFSAMRPVLLNGITELATRPDALDRALLISCPNVSKEHRRDEETIWREFGEAHPKLLGALLTAFCAAVKKLPDIHLAEMERMADFEKFGVAAEAALGFPTGTFQAAYTKNRREASDVAIDSSTTAILVIAFMGERDNWTGTATQLLAELKGFAEAHKELGIRPEELPKKANLLSGELKRTAPNLRGKGIEFRRKHSGSRTIALEKTVNSSSASSASPNSSEHLGVEASISDDAGDMGDEEGDPASRSPIYKPQQAQCLDDVGDVDDDFVPLSDKEDYSDEVLGTAGGKPYTRCLSCGRHTYIGQDCPYCVT